MKFKEEVKEIGRSFIKLMYEIKEGGISNLMYFALCLISLVLIRVGINLISEIKIDMFKGYVMGFIMICYLLIFMYFFDKSEGFFNIGMMIMMVGFMVNNKIILIYVSTYFVVINFTVFVLIKYIKPILMPLLDKKKNVKK